MSQTALGGIAKWLIAPESKVDVPEWNGVDINAIQNETIGSIKQSLPGAEQVGAEVNQFNLKQQLAALTQTANLLLPGGLDKIRGIINNELAGNVPSDVMANIQRSAVSGAYGRGYGPSSGLSQNAFTGMYAFASQAQQQQGKQDFSNLMSLGPKAPLFDLTNLFFSPQQRLENAMQQAQIRYNISLQKAQIAAAPDPNMSNIAEGIDNDIKMVEQAALSYAGGGMGGGGQSFYSGSNPKGVEGSGAGKMPSGGWGNTVNPLDWNSTGE